MTSPLRVVFIASEAAPFAKTGGLADVAGSLPNALRGLNVDIRVILRVIDRCLNTVCIMNRSGPT